MTSNFQGGFEWWLERKGSNAVHDRLFGLINWIAREQAIRRDDNVKTLRLYGGPQFQNFDPYNYSNQNTLEWNNDRARFNIVSSAVDTVYSKIGKNRPRPLLLTDGGDYSTQKRVKKLNKFLFGMFDQIGMYKKGQECFRDGCIFDVGAVKFYVEDNMIKCERVLPNEIFVDTADAVYDNPNRMYQVKYVAKSVLKGMYPKKLHALIDAAAGYLEGTNVAPTANAETNYVVVVEAWQLGDSPKYKNGRHVISLSNTTLVDEEYTRNKFPFTFFRWTKPLVGFYGQSLAYRLIGKQIEINRMLQIIEQSFHLGATFKVFLEHGARVAKEHLNNQIGSLVYYTGTPPIYTVPQTVHPEFFQHLQWLIDASYQEAGISQLSAQAKKPTGLDAGVAIREMQDIESERFAVTEQQYEQFYLDCAGQVLDLADIVGGDLAVKAESKKFLETIKWKDVVLDRNSLVTQMFPTAMLPKQPAGRLNTVNDMMQMGLIDNDLALSLLDFPDLTAASEMKLAPYNDLRDTFDRIIEDGEYSAPEPFQNLQLGIRMAKDSYYYAKGNGVEEEKLEMLRRWMAVASQMMQSTQQAAQQEQMQQEAPQEAPEQAAQPIQPLPPTGGSELP